LGSFISIEKSKVCCVGSNGWINVAERVCCI